MQAESYLLQLSDCSVSVGGVAESCCVFSRTETLNKDHIGLGKESSIQITLWYVQPLIIRKT